MRVNISVPDELAAEVRRARLPVSAICQRALRAELNGGPVTDVRVNMTAKCARCLAGLCDHQECKAPGFGMEAVTAVAGTDCCGECAPSLLELVLHPLTTVVVNPQVATGGGSRTARPVTSSRWAGPVS